MPGSKVPALCQKLIKHILEDVSVTAGVRVCKGTAGHAGQPEMIPLPVVTPETDLDVAEARKPPRLSKQEDQKLLPAGKAPGVIVSPVSINTFFEPVSTNELQNLRKYRIPMHGQSSYSVSKNGKINLNLH